MYLQFQRDSASSTSSFRRKHYKHNHTQFFFSISSHLLRGDSSPLFNASFQRKSLCEKHVCTKQHHFLRCPRLGTWRLLHSSVFAALSGGSCAVCQNAWERPLQLDGAFSFFGIDVLFSGLESVLFRPQDVSRRVCAVSGHLCAQSV